MLAIIVFRKNFSVSNDHCKCKPTFVWHIVMRKKTQYIRLEKMSWIYWKKQWLTDLITNVSGMLLCRLIFPNSLWLSHQDHNGCHCVLIRSGACMCWRDIFWLLYTRTYKLVWSCCKILSLLTRYQNYYWDESSLDMFSVFGKDNNLLVQENNTLTPTKAICWPLKGCACFSEIYSSFGV